MTLILTIGGNSIPLICITWAIVASILANPWGSLQRGPTNFHSLVRIGHQVVDCRRPIPIRFISANLPLSQIFWIIYDVFSSWLHALVSLILMISIQQ